MAPYKTSQKFVMAPYFEQILFSQNGAWSRMVISKSSKKSAWSHINLNRNPFKQPLQRKCGQETQENLTSSLPSEKPKQTR